MLDLLPRPVSTMTTYPPLNKALVIDPSGELRDFLRFCAARLWPNLQIISYLWARGCPDESYEWTGFDLVVLEQRLHNRQARGIDWLRAALGDRPRIAQALAINRTNICGAMRGMNCSGSSLRRGTGGSI